MDCWTLGGLADNGEYDGQSGPLAVTCYLIPPPDGHAALGQSGLSDKLAENKDAKRRPVQVERQDALIDH